MFTAAKFHHSAFSVLPKYAFVGFAGCLILLTANRIDGQTSARPQAAPARLLADLRSKDSQVRRDAANELGVTRARGAVRTLVEALSDKEPTVREAAAFALGQISDTAATSLLIPLLADSNAEVR